MSICCNTEKLTESPFPLVSWTLHTVQISSKSFLSVRQKIRELERRNTKIVINVLLVYIVRCEVVFMRETSIPRGVGRGGYENRDRFTA